MSVPSVRSPPILDLYSCSTLPAILLPPPCQIFPATVNAFVQMNNQAGYAAGVSATDEPSERHPASPFVPQLAPVHTTPTLRTTVPLCWSATSPPATSKCGAA
ncbi:hypothetical protein OH77DRAFT_1424212 [Trametes cingulata]|nr:hypothetical protein OH77DRAFT_1424212 [Trametes cingulata]